MKNGKYSISVGEPWDFKSEDGQNIIRGNLLRILSNKCIVFQADHYLKLADVSGNILVLTPRHLGYDFSRLVNEIIDVNGSILLTDYDVKLNETELKNNSKFEIIGSIKHE